MLTERREGGTQWWRRCTTGAGTQPHFWRSAAHIWIWKLRREQDAWTSCRFISTKMVLQRTAPPRNSWNMVSSGPVNMDAQARLNFYWNEESERTAVPRVERRDCIGPPLPATQKSWNCCLQQTRR